MADCDASALIDAGALKEIIDTDLSDSRLCNFINMAYVMTIPLAGNLDQCGGDTALELIQLNLAAHFLTMYERTLKSQNVAGEWSATYAMKDGEGLRSSLYGQNAIAMDCSGILARTGLRKASLQVISHYQLEDSEYLLDPDLVT